MRSGYGCYCRNYNCIIKHPISPAFLLAFIGIALLMSGGFEAISLWQANKPYNALYLCVGLLGIDFIAIFIVMAARGYEFVASAIIMIIACVIGLVIYSILLFYKTIVG